MRNNDEVLPKNWEFYSEQDNTYIYPPNDRGYNAAKHSLPLFAQAFLEKRDFIFK